MEDVFEEREQGEEAKFKLDQELRFKVQARRNRKTGMWLAQRMGFEHDRAEAFAREVVEWGLERSGDRGLIAHLIEEAAAHQTRIEAAELERRLARFRDEALRELQDSYPTPLDTDHRQVGG